MGMGQSMRCIEYLLRGGASRDIRVANNPNGNRAYDFALENSNASKALKEILNEKWSFTRDFLMIARANKKLKSSRHVLLLYYVVMGTAFALICTSVFPEFNYMGRLYWL